MELVYEISAKVVAKMDSADGGLQHVFHGTLRFSWAPGAEVNLAIPVPKVVWDSREPGEFVTFSFKG